MREHTKFLTIHGHFYQPPRENPWLDAIELQESALPWHDWNERINRECYNPNSVSRIVDGHNKIIDIVNNYKYMSFNFGPTLMSWLEQFAPLTYERVIQADIDSRAMYSGHGNAIAQVYNHMIMPLANLRDKYTQTIWGIKDFESRFGRKPEGIWLAETAVDDQTLEVLYDCGVKYTVLSPYQAAKVKALDGSDWHDVSWGNIDPARAYRYFIKNNPEKYVDLFFYDGAISRSVAFDNLLKDGNKFVHRLQEGVSEQRDYDQLVNIGTDGESYGHHTKFGDMALAYVLGKKAKEAGFTITNYAEYLEKYPPEFEADIKQPSSWSCFHGVGRWQDDCGCSTGGHGGWNQKWRRPLRDALDWLRDELSVIYENSASKYLKEPWEARDAYINVILDRNELTLNKFFKKHQTHELSEEEKTATLRLLEIQRNAMLMYTSCGWFFSEISGIETTQIMKYAARAMELAINFSDKPLEESFLQILEKAQSNIPQYGNGREIYEKFVKPAVVHRKQIVTQWALKSLYEDPCDEENIYCYAIEKMDYRKLQKSNTTLAVGRIKVKSKITLSVQDFVFAVLRFSGGDFHCAVSEFTSSQKYNKVKKELVDKYTQEPLTEVIRTLDEHLDRNYFTLDDIFLEERRHLLGLHLNNKVSKFSSNFRTMYEESRRTILQLSELGVDIPPEMKIVAKYTLSKDFNALFESADDILDKDVIQNATDIIKEVDSLKIILDTKSASKLFESELLRNLRKLTKNIELQETEVVAEILETAQVLKIILDLNEAQNIYFEKIFSKMPEIMQITLNSKDSKIRQLVRNLIKIGKFLDINVESFEKQI
ncbi:MAG: DUF3536 domain-containing protein [Candidatus Gastranaerophilales bacterium]|nr:DUF3536 domain-containing protein [Candidatus Gastranaerophilales bacterium]